MNAEGRLQQRAYGIASRLIRLLLAVVAAISVWTPLTDERIAHTEVGKYAVSGFPLALNACSNTGQAYGIAYSTCSFPPTRTPHTLRQ